MSNKEIINKILELKKKHNAVILAHNYQVPEVQDVADYLGDSLELSRQASRLNEKVIVFCGVHFMAETASILCPDKKVLLPDLNAGCPMANMITANKLRELKQKHPKAIVVAYVNTSASVKAEVDVCCTSTNAVKIVNTLKDYPEIIFVPDKYLANYVSRQTGRKLIAWEGFCPTHVKILPEDIQREKNLHPKAKVVVHPECRPQVIDLADATRSTSGICRYVKETNDEEFIIGTETGLIYRLQKENPEKSFYPASKLAVCPNMKEITLEKVLWSLEDMQYEVKVPEDIRIKAKKAVDKMLEVA